MTETTVRTAKACSGATDSFVTEYFRGIMEKRGQGPSFPVNLGCHFAAFVCAFAAFVRAHLAVLVFEFVAFGCACVANGSADGADLLGVHTVSSHVLRSQCANVGAIVQHLDAMYSCLYVGLFQASGEALCASLHTTVARIDAGLIHILGMYNGRHSYFLLVLKYAV
jgi:hypothetical protein